MPFIPHTSDDIDTMLAAIGVKQIDDLFDEIPAELCVDPEQFSHVSEGMGELQVSQLMHMRAWKDRAGLCFIGAGAYEHHIPAAVWEIAGRGEFLTSYTPYQAEASQGTLELIDVYQSMMGNLMDMEVSNASMYDGASALAEAVLMAVRLQKKHTDRKILVPITVNPVYRKVLETIVSTQGITIETLPYCTEKGVTLVESLARYEKEAITALVIPQPNFFGMMEDVDALTDWAHAQDALVIGVVNPMAMALLEPPGQWGSGEGADIVCGEGQPLGVPLASGGPYFGFLCCRNAAVRQMPGRIVGKTVDRDGKSCYTLTLQAREQHIRRSKATSNICTNQGLLVTAATIYISLMGAEGLRRVALTSHANIHRLLEALAPVAGVSPVFHGPCFHEQVIRFERPVDEVLAALSAEGVQAGYDLRADYPELGEALLVCTTETKSMQHLAHYAAILKRILS